MIDLPELLILDVGHGNCAILRDTEAVTVIDCGRDETILQVLERLGVDRVDHVLISHADIDHVGGLLPLLDEIPVRNIYLNPDSTKKGGKTWKDVGVALQVAQDSGTQVHVGLTTRYSQKIVSGEVEIEILAPSAAVAINGPGGVDAEGHTLASNSMSVVVGLVHNSHRVALLPADMDEVGLNNLLRIHKDIEAQTLVFPHHGGNTGSADNQVFAQRLCELVKPDLVIFSLHREQHSNPKEAIVRGVVAALPNAHIMCTQLSQKCSTLPLSSDFSHLTNLPAKGRLDRACCGGTVRIKVDGDRTTYAPLSALHGQFVKTLSAPLCLRYLTKA